MARYRKPARRRVARRKVPGVTNPRLNKAQRKQKNLEVINSAPDDKLLEACKAWLNGPNSGTGKAAQSIVWRLERMEEE